MLAPLSESAPAQDPSADKSDIAQTVPQSVMAEQVSHNVVNVSESASGSSPLVDVVANHTSTAASEGGNNTDATSAYKPQDSYANNSNTPMAGRSKEDTLRLSQALGMPWLSLTTFPRFLRHQMPTMDLT